MTRIRSTGMIFSLALFGIGGCINHTNDNHPTCYEPYSHLCADNFCHQCCQDADCGGDAYTCSANGLCVQVCNLAGDECFHNGDVCCDGLTCDWLTGTCVEACADDQECLAAVDPPPQGLTCWEGLCVQQPCAQPEDCQDPLACFDGGCQASPECAGLDSCLITRTRIRTAPGEIGRLTALALLADGRVAPGVQFDWSSADAAVATVADGRVVGGETSGTVEIRASVRGCQVECSATVHNPGPVPTGMTRVVAFEAETGAPVEGVTLTLDGEAAGTTDAAGVALIDPGPPPGRAFELTASSQDFHYLTLRGATGQDLRLALDRIDDRDSAAGFRGALQQVAIPCQDPGHPCEFQFGLAGASLPARLHRLDARSLLGGRMRTVIEIFTSRLEPLLPGGSVLSVAETNYKERFAPVGTPGPRLTWAIHESSDLADVIRVLGPVISDDNLDSSTIFMQLLMAASAVHVGLGPVVQLESIPKVADPADIDGDGRTDDRVPDRGAFPHVDLEALQPAHVRLQLQVPDLPVDVYDAVLVIAAVEVDGMGLVPLGLGVGLDEPSSGEANDGIIDDPVIVELAPLGDRLPEGAVERVILALAFNQASYGSDGVPKRLAGQVLKLDRFEDQVISLEPFMEQTGLAYDPATSTLSIDRAPDGAEIVQAFFADEQGRGWFAIGSVDDGEYQLPAAPPEGDRGQRAAVLAIQPGPGGSWENLAAGRVPLEAPLAWVRAFSYTEAAQP